MADSSINVTEGSGKRLQTYDVTVSSVIVQRQAVVLGEQPLASYIVGSASTISLATAGSHLIQIMAGAGNRIRLRRIEIYQIAAATAVTMGTFVLYRLSTAGTGGTSLAPVALNPADAAADATGMILPTAKGTENGAIVAGTMIAYQTLATGAAPAPSLVWEFDRPRSGPIQIAAGTSNGIAIKNITAIAGATVTVNVWLDETSW